jgi:PST family polysaccharide transporter
MSIVRSSLYSLSGNISKILLSIGGIIILGRILGPATFGEFAIVMAVHTMLQPFINIGLGPAYYKVDSTDENASDAFFSLQAFLGLSIAGIVALIAYPLAQYYENERLVGLFLLLSLSQACLGLGLQPYAEITKNNNYGILALIQLSSLIVGLGTGIIMALSGFGIWSLAFKFLTSSIISMLGYFWLARRRYNLVSVSSILVYRKSIIFSMKLGLGRLVSGFSNGLDKMMLGSYFDETILGNYDRAFQFSQYPDTAIRTSLTNPILTYIANDENPGEKYLKIFKVMYLLAGSICVGFFVFGERLITLLLGNGWEVAALLFPILGILALGKVLRGIYLVIEVNEGNGSEILRRSILSTVFVYAVGFTVLYLYRDVYLFSWAFSLSWVTYWFGSLYLFFKGKLGIGAANSMALFFATLVLSLAGIGLMFKWLIFGVMGFEVVELVISILLTTVVFFAVFSILYKKDVAELKLLLKRKKK